MSTVLHIHINELRALITNSLSVLRFPSSSPPIQLIKVKQLK